MKKSNKKSNEKPNRKGTKKSSKKTASKGGSRTSKQPEKRTAKGKSIQSKKSVSMDKKQNVQNSNTKGNRTPAKNPTTSGNRKPTKISAAEKENLRILNELFNAEEKRTRISKEKGQKGNDKQSRKTGTDRQLFKPVKFTERKKRGENVIELNFATKSNEKIIQTINVKKFPVIKRITETNTKFPKYAIVIIKHRNKADKEDHYLTIPSGFGTPLNSEETVKAFIASAIAEFNNDRIPEIMDKYDANFSDFYIKSVFVRFVF